MPASEPRELRVPNWKSEPNSVKVERSESEPRR
jgi:hypothetical protein